MRRRFFGVVHNIGTAKRVAFLILLEGFRVEPIVFERLSESKIQMAAIFVGQSATRKLRAYVLDVPWREAKRLDVGKAPIGLAEIRLQRDTPAVRANGIALPAFGLECMAITQPNLKLIGIIFGELLVHSDGAREVPDPDQCGGSQIAEARIVRRALHQKFRLCKQFRRPVQAMKSDGIAVACGEKPWSDLKAACEEFFRILITAKPHCHFAVHANGMRIGWKFLQESAQQGFGNAGFVFSQRHCGPEQSRIANRCPDLIQISVVGCIDIADDSQLIPEFPPRRGKFGIEFDRVHQRSNSLPDILRTDADRRGCEIVSRL